MKKINEINLLFSQGIVPDEFNFVLERKPLFDFSKIWYNEYYQSTNYISSKFSSGWQSIPGFDKIINKMSEISLLPLEELELRKNILSNNI